MLNRFASNENRREFLQLKHVQVVCPQRMRADESDLYLFPGVLLAVVDVRSSVDS